SVRRVIMSCQPPPGIAGGRATRHGENVAARQIRGTGYVCRNARARARGDRDCGAASLPAERRSIPPDGPRWRACRGGTGRAHGRTPCQEMTRNERHLAAAWLASQALNRAVPPGWFVGQDHRVVIQPQDQPEPDLTLIRGRIRDYLDRKPGPRDVALVVEVSDSSYVCDHT